MQDDRAPAPDELVWPPSDADLDALEVVALDPAPGDTSAPEGDALQLPDVRGDDVVSVDSMLEADDLGALEAFAPEHGVGEPIEGAVTVEAARAIKATAHDQGTKPDDVAEIAPIPEVVDVAESGPALTDASATPPIDNADLPPAASLDAVGPAPAPDARPVSTGREPAPGDAIPSPPSPLATAGPHIPLPRASTPARQTEPSRAPSVSAPVASPGRLLLIDDEGDSRASGGGRGRVVIVLAGVGLAALALGWAFGWVDPVSWLPMW